MSNIVSIDEDTLRVIIIGELRRVLVDIGGTGISLERSQRFAERIYEAVCEAAAIGVAPENTGPRDTGTIAQRATTLREKFKELRARTDAHPQLPTQHHIATDTLAACEALAELVGQAARWL